MVRLIKITLGLRLKLRRLQLEYRIVNKLLTFSYMENGDVIVEDVKGIKTPAYQIKKKMFLKKHSEFIVFREIYISGKKTEIKEI